MMTIFVDTNVLIDFVGNRQPFSISAGKLFTLALTKRIKIYISAISYNNIYYILRQHISHKEVLRMLSEISELTELIDLTKPIISNSMISDFKDFEDALQYYSVLSVTKIECIVTRDTKDFKSSSLPVMTPDEVLAKFENSNK